VTPNGLIRAIGCGTESTTGHVIQLFLGGQEDIQAVKNREGAEGKPLHTPVHEKEFME